TPFAYAPQGHIPSPRPDYESCVLSPEPSDSCYCTVPPTYFGTIFLDVIVLDRRGQLESSDLYFDSLGNPVLNIADLDLAVEAGIRTGLILTHPSGNDLVFEYFGIHSFEESERRADPAGVTDVFFGQAGAPLPTLTAEYSSILDSASFQIRTRQSRRIAPISGVRYVQIDEQFNSMQDPTTRQGWFSHSDNDLFGYEFGLQGLLWQWGAVRLETTAKAGPYFNDVDVHVSLNPPGQTTMITRHASHWHTAFVGDIRIGLVCQLGRRMNFRIGYDALWIDGVALGPNQNNNISYTTNLVTVDLTDVLYQGGNIGFDLSW
ncbi:MAG: hypothetical protein AB7O38_28400, partial [Pirellulaceae bacterium]